jgi:RNA polymerase sigma factor (sigma-70 family)
VSTRFGRVKRLNTEMGTIRSRLEVDDPLDSAVESFEAFYRREYRDVLTIARVLTSDRAQAEDLTQEAFLAAYASWSGISSPATWIRAAVTNKAMSWWRRIYAARRAVSRISPAHNLDDMPEDTEYFWSAVRRLPRRQAQSLTLYYLEDRPTKEIAAVLGCDESTVRIHLSRGRKALASQLKVAE